jgi:hypothetical protein
MKLQSKQSSTHRPTSDELLELFESQTDDWTEAQQLLDDYYMAEYSEELATGLRRPNPPAKEMIKRAQFVDKTYIWKNAGLRSGK